MYCSTSCTFFHALKQVISGLTYLAHLHIKTADYKNRLCTISRYVVPRKREFGVWRLDLLAFQYLFDFLFRMTVVPLIGIEIHFI